MSNVYFGKFNDISQVNDRIYKMDNLSFIGDIQPGDYAFIKLEKETNPATVKRLWRLREVETIGAGWSVAHFDEVFEFNPLQLQKFEALSLFVLDVNLLNKCNKQTKGLSFYKLSIVDEDLWNRVIASADAFNSYIFGDSNCRKVERINDRNDIDYRSINVQFYKEGESWLIADTLPFIGEDLKSNYDSSQYDLYARFGNKGTNTAKDKMYTFLSGIDIDVPMMGIWDLFCGTVKDSSVALKKKKYIAKREGFIEYCKENGVKRTAGVYESGLRSIEKEMNIDLDEEYSKDECKDLLSKISEYAKSFSAETVGNRINWVVYVKKFVEYKNNASLEEKHDLESKDSAMVLPYDYSQAKHCGYNKVFYGTPGCGKSYHVENTVIPEEDIDVDLVVRTTFYNDYTNTDFVGQIIPQVEGEKVLYKFIPGPFTKALKFAIENPEEKVALIIEELNRGNAPSIFGDIFQLLDRKEGTSRYPIVNINIQNYLRDETMYNSENLRIPANLYIFATMNTSDQNVFTLDTAFKRRWSFEKIPNKFIGNESIALKYIPGFNNVTWRKFNETINKFIVSHATSLSAEDKQMGKYFIDSS